MKILDCPQRSTEWKSAREACLCTASDAGQFIFGSDKRSVTARRSRIFRYLRQQMTATVPLDAWEIQDIDDDERKLKYNTAINRGNAQEDEARQLFAEIHDAIIATPGLILSDCGLFGASPDGLIVTREIVEIENLISLARSADAGLEIKCPELKTLIKWITDGKLPEEHEDQCHFSMAVSGLRKWWFMGYFRGAPPLIVPVEWNDYTQKLHDGMQTFRSEMEELRATFRANWKRCLTQEEGRAA